MMNCIIVGDNEYSIVSLQNHLKLIKQLNLVACFTNPVEAINSLEAHQVKLIFLHVNLPRSSGLDLLQAICHTNCYVVITTTHREFAVDAFDLGVVDYLLMPTTFARFLQAVIKVQKLIASSITDVISQSAEEDYFVVKTSARGKMIKINIEDIDYIEGMKNYVAFHHNGARTLALITMKDLQVILPAKGFMRVQKSFIIALKKVVEINGNHVRLKGIDNEIIMGDAYKRHFLDTIKKKLIT